MIKCDNMKHELFEVGLYDYSDLDERLKKPVRWTEEDLKQIAENYRGGIPLTSEHDKVYLMQLIIRLKKKKKKIKRKENILKV